MSIEGAKEVYPCDGVQTEFAITFPFASDREVSAFISNHVTGERRRLVRNLDYTIRGTTLVLRHDDFRDPWSADWDLCIMSRARIEQGSSQAMAPATFAKRANQLTQMLRQIREQTLRTLHIGATYPPLNLTSAPYAYIMFDSVGSAGAMVTGGMWPPSFENEVRGTDIRMLDGVMNLPIITYEDWPADEVGSTGIEVLSGTMVEPILTYSDWPADEVESTVIEVLSGVMFDPIVLYAQWPADEVEATDIKVVSGEMT